MVSWLVETVLCSSEFMLLSPTTCSKCQMSTFAPNFSLVMVTGGGLILVSWLGGGVHGGVSVSQSHTRVVWKSGWPIGAGTAYQLGWLSLCHPLNHRGNIGTLDDLAVRVIPDCPFGVASGWDLTFPDSTPPRILIWLDSSVLFSASKAAARSSWSSSRSS